MRNGRTCTRWGALCSRRWRSARRLVHEPNVALLQVAQSAVDELRALRRRARREVVALDECRTQAPAGRVEGSAGSGDAATDHQHVELLRRQVVAASPRSKGGNGIGLILGGRSRPPPSAIDGTLTWSSRPRSGVTAATRGKPRSAGRYRHQSARVINQQLLQIEARSGYAADVRSPAELTAAFRQQGLKVTPQRQCIFRVLHDNAEHPTAEPCTRRRSPRCPRSRCAPCTRRSTTWRRWGRSTHRSRYRLGPLRPEYRRPSPPRVRSVRHGPRRRGRHRRAGAACSRPQGFAVTPPKSSSVVVVPRAADVEFITPRKKENNVGPERFKDPREPERGVRR